MQMEPDQSASGSGSRPPDFRQSSTPELSRPARLIAELIVAPEFPKSALGELVDIGGYIGVVVDVVSQSLKVKSAEGVTKSFNAGGLRKLYGPRIVPEPSPMRESPPSPPPPRKTFEREPPPLPPAPKREIVVNPDFSKPITKISAYLGRPDYPKCLLGEHVDIGGYAGVVVEIVSRSVKVRSEAETTRSYNADSLRKLYGSS
jgi:hypothetical protein